MFFDKQINSNNETISLMVGGGVWCFVGVGDGDGRGADVGCGKTFSCQSQLQLWLDWIYLKM